MWRQPSTFDVEFDALTILRVIVLGFPGIVKTYIFGSFVLYIPLSRTTMSVFSCVDIHGTEYLSGALDQECYNEDHYKYMLVGLVCVLLYPLGIPASWLFLLRR